MINVLIYKSLETKDLTKLRKVPKMLLAEGEIEAFQWIFDYEKKYGESPSIDRFRTTKHAFLLPGRLEDTDVNIDDALDETVFLKKKLFLLKSIRDWEIGVREAEKIEDLKFSSMRQTIDKTATVGTKSKLKSVADFGADREKLYLPIDEEDVFSYCFPTIDKATGGLRKSEFALLSARIQTGKSMVLCWISTRWAMQGKRVLLVSNEMSYEQIMARIDAMIGGFNPMILRQRTDAALMQSMKSVVEERVKTEIIDKGGELIIPEERCITPDALFSTAKEAEADIICVDGIYLMMPSSGQKLLKHERIAEVSNTIKQHCLTFNLPVFATTQLKRGLDSTDGKLDTEALAYSDALGQDADVVFAMQSDSHGSKNFSLSIAKNRNGSSLFTAMCTMDFSSMKIYETGSSGTK